MTGPAPGLQLAVTWQRVVCSASTQGRIRTGADRIRLAGDAARRSDESGTQGLLANAVVQRVRDLALYCGA